MSLKKELMRYDSNLCSKFIKEHSLQKKYHTKKKENNQIKKIFCEDCYFKEISDNTPSLGKIQEIKYFYEYAMLKDLHECELNLDFVVCHHCKQKKNSKFYNIFTAEYISMPEIISLFPDSKDVEGKNGPHEKKIEESAISDYLFKKDESSEKNLGLSEDSLAFEYIKFAENCYLDILSRTP